MLVKKQTLPLCWPGPNHFIRPPAPGRAERKAARTTMVFTWRQETQRTKLIPKAACCKRQDHTEGRPMNTSAHRKQSLSDRRSRKLSSELFARTWRWIMSDNTVNLNSNDWSEVKNEGGIWETTLLTWPTYCFKVKHWLCTEPSPQECYGSTRRWQKQL